MAKIKTLLKGMPGLDNESDIGVSHLPGCGLIDQDTACGRTAEMRCEWEYGEGTVTCPACLEAAKDLLKCLTYAEIKELRKR